MNVENFLRLIESAAKLMNDEQRADVAAHVVACATQSKRAASDAEIQMEKAERDVRRSRR